MTTATRSAAVRHPSRVDIAGVHVDTCGMEDAVTRIGEWARTDKAHVAIGVNANVCNLACTNERMAELVRQADLSYADGQSIVWAARLFGAKIPNRVATTDLIQPLAELAERDSLPMYFFGAAPGVAAAAATRLGTKFPNLRIATHHGYVSDVDSPAVVQSIRDHKTAILFVGLGDPRQQEWVARHRDELGVPAILTCGGLFDWISGNNKRAPRWMIATGLEWLWRLALEPRRLASRYLRGNPAFVARVLKQLLFAARDEPQLQPARRVGTTLAGAEGSLRPHTRL